MRHIYPRSDNDDDDDDDDDFVLNIFFHLTNTTESPLTGFR